VPMQKTMVAFDYIKSTRDYLDYLEEHIGNVEKAWKEIQEKCKHFHFIYDDNMFFWIDQEVMHHDESKFSIEEFVQYRQKFHKVEHELVKPGTFDQAWDHHKLFNDHHWETWTTKKYKIPYEWKVHCVHMIVDWVAMSYKTGITAKSYFKANNDLIKFPDYSIPFIEEVLDCLES